MLLAHQHNMRCCCCKRFSTRRRFSPPLLCAAATMGAVLVRALAGGRAGCGGRCCCSVRESNCRPAGARRRSATCFRVPPRSIHHECPPRAAGGAAGRSRRRCWVLQCDWGAVSSGGRRLDAKRPSRTHSRAIFEPFTLSNSVRAVGSKAHVVCCSSCHHTDRRLNLGHPRLALARWRWSQQNNNALHGAAAARARLLSVAGCQEAQELTKRHQSSSGPWLTCSRRRRVPTVIRRRTAHPARGDRAAAAATGPLPR